MFFFSFFIWRKRGTTKIFFLFFHLWWILFTDFEHRLSRVLIFRFFTLLEKLRQRRLWGLDPENDVAFTNCKYKSLGRTAKYLKKITWSYLNLICDGPTITIADFLAKLEYTMCNTLGLLWFDVPPAASVVEELCKDMIIY